MAKRVYIAGAGVISPLGTGLAATEAALRDNRSAIKPLTLFTPLHGKPLPVGQVAELDECFPLPRTHRLALVAAMQAMASSAKPPDAVILGNTTGGILTTEQLLKDKADNKALYRYHGLNTVTEFIAELLGCHGPAITVSTACSSGAAAIAMALKMLRSGKAQTVLAGGVDSLCRLTYFGFHALQLVDREGCKPLDIDRHGMAVGEGAAMLLLSTEKPDHPLAELLGAGLSCDAYHPAAPHPEGHGALMAMRAALADAGLKPADIDYINLHGTGTPENDLAEAKAITTLFAEPPPLSSIKGATGHTLAAAGAIEAVVSVSTVVHNLQPANTGCLRPDPALGLTPLSQPVTKQTSAVLSNSFGFGGNNGCLVITKADRFAMPAAAPAVSGLAIHGWACLTGAGGTEATMSLLAQGKTVDGMADLNAISKNLPPPLVRRLKRLPRMTLSLAQAAHQNSGLTPNPASVFLGTGWGALTETYDFLTRLSDSEDQFPSPTDFVGSVHNGPAGQAAIMLGATGANLTVSGGDYSFEQALLATEMFLEKDDNTGLVLGVDEGHPALSPLFDFSILPGTPLADGGGALVVSHNQEKALGCVRLLFYESSAAPRALDDLLTALGGVQTIGNKYRLLLVGIPAGEREKGEIQLARFMQQSGCTAPVIDYRRLTGEFASASAVAAVMAVSFLAAGQMPDALVTGDNLALESAGDTILVLGLGRYFSAMEFSRS